MKLPRLAGVDKPTRHVPGVMTLVIPREKSRTVESNHRAAEWCRLVNQPD